VSGVDNEGLRITAFPIASAEAVWINGCANGSEDDVTSATTPSGS
jgi:hypothetical protein